jgi:hypothetical protein
MDSDKKLIQLSHHAGAKLLEGDGLRCMKGASLWDGEEEEVTQPRPYSHLTSSPTQPHPAS